MLWNVRTDILLLKHKKINYNVSTQGFFQSGNQATNLFWSLSCQTRFAGLAFKTLWLENTSGCRCKRGICSVNASSYCGATLLINFCSHQNHSWHRSSIHPGLSSCLVSLAALCKCKLAVIGQLYIDLYIKGMDKWHLYNSYHNS